jgi:hypothetical protein
MPPRSSYPSKPRTMNLALSAVWCLSLLVSWPAMAQTDANTAYAWRATSRLGYGPTPAAAQAAQQNPQAWALGQLETAYAASQRAPNIPPDIAQFNQPIGKLAQDFRAEREARKNIKEQASQAKPGVMTTNNAAEPTGFSREMTQTANAG